MISPKYAGKLAGAAGPVGGRVLVATNQAAKSFTEGEVERLLKEHQQNQELVDKIGSSYYQIIYPVQLRHHEKMGISTREVNPPKVRYRFRDSGGYGAPPLDGPNRSRARKSFLSPVYAGAGASDGGGHGGVGSGVGGGIGGGGGGGIGSGVGDTSGMFLGYSGSGGSGRGRSRENRGTRSRSEIRKSSTQPRPAQNFTVAGCWVYQLTTLPGGHGAPAWLYDSPVPVFRVDCLPLYAIATIASAHCRLLTMPVTMLRQQPLLLLLPLLMWLAACKRPFGRADQVVKAEGLHSKDTPTARTTRLLVPSSARVLLEFSKK
uniref:Uncharacterized protein n=1 Tax=Anopheles albimanus TaxID=7167 RepID=A0A182FJR6_ANOAL